VIEIAETLIQPSFQGFCGKTTKMLARKGFQGFSGLLPNNSNIFWGGAARSAAPPQKILGFI
jgi:hypothetical protein